METAAAAAARTAAAAVGTAAAAAETAAAAGTAGTAAETAAAGRAGTGNAVLDDDAASAIPCISGLAVEAGTEAEGSLEDAAAAGRCPDNHSAGAVELEPVEVELGLESTSVAGSADLLVGGPPGLKVHWQVAEQVPERVAVVGPEREA